MNLHDSYNAPFFKGAPYDKPLFKRKSFWTPPLDKQNDNVKNYVKAVQKDILSAIIGTKKKELKTI